MVNPSMKAVPILLLISSIFLFADDRISFPGTWIAEQDAASRKISSGNKIFSASAVFPGGFLLFKERSRASAKPERLFFDSRVLSFRVRVSRISAPLKAWIFVKDKDGAWFQTGREFRLEPGRWTTLEVRLDLPGKELFPIGHSAAWNGFYASRIFAAGISFWSDDEQKALIEWEEPFFSGKREDRELFIRNWNLPGEGRAYETIRSRFELNREYFNPFDPDEIQADFEVISPDSPEKTETWPAFYSQDFRIRRHFTEESFLPEGLPFWEFRFVPKKTGLHRLRLIITDRSSGKPEILRSEWKEIRIGASDSPGFIRVGKDNPAYFEFENGKFFYPIGINIHSNTDQRSENLFGFGHLADRGNADYEEYIRSCSAAGINVMEIWMAAWTFAIEWSSCRPGYYGIGFYHLGRAAKLDALLDHARDHNIYISLVFDNHGKFSDSCDPEWHESPFNANSYFAEADSAFLKSPGDFWTDPRAIRANEKRNRYIAARWGACPEIFAFQLWSEVDLVANAWKFRNDGTMVKWHRKTASYLRKMIQGKQLISSHVCGEIGNLMEWKSVVVEPPELDHVCCDAYRDYWIPIARQMQLHQASISSIRKPVLITEYGRTSRLAISPAAADVHGGIWSSLFTRHAGTPWLWWHDFIHRKNLYPHYRGFSKFLKGLDPGKGRVSFGEISASGKIFDPRKPVIRKFLPSGEKTILPQKLLSGLYYQQDEEFVCGWIYRMKYLFAMPMDPDDMIPVTGIKAEIRTELRSGSYLIQYYDTVSGELISSEFLSHGKTGKVILNVPDLRLDCAFKLSRIGGPL